MQFIIKIAVRGTAAILTEMPKLSEGTLESVTLAVAFDESWAGIEPRRAVLWREGDALLHLDLNEDGTAAVPTAFAASEQPFYIRITGRETDSLSTNELCASFFDLHTAEATEPRYKVHGGSHTIVKNGTYFSKNALLTDAVQVAIPFNADTTRDTVTVETLHKGYTAHDANGKPIEGTYVNPYNADTTRDTVTAETLHKGYTAHDANGEPIAGTYFNPYNADTTRDTVTAETLYDGFTAHDANGEPITGTYTPPDFRIASVARAVSARAVVIAAPFTSVVTRS